MSLLPGIALYDPRRLPEADFLSGFIARTTLADHLIEQFRKTVTDGRARHRVILGGRGMGKTSLLRRLGIGIARDPALSAALLPLTFREEQYNVRSLDRLWRNCAEALAEWLEQSGDAVGAAALDAELDRRDGPWDEAESAGDAFLARAAATGRRPVLLIDNLDLILDALPEDQHWQWRRRLQAEGGPIVVGAAVQPPRQLGVREAAFYEFFRLDQLDPLTEADLLRCLERLAHLRGTPGERVLAVMRREPARLRVLHALTGGNPRILTLLYQLLERAESDDVFGDLEGLLDQVTPLYKARVEELKTPLQRAMLDAVALHWDPITAKKLAQATGEPVTTVSSQLSRLRDWGYVEEVATSGTRAGYQVAERFFNIWYLMRHGTRRTRQRVRWLAAFLQTFFSAEELHGLRARVEAETGDPRWREMLREALAAALAREAAGEVDEAAAAMQNWWRIGGVAFWRALDIAEWHRSRKRPAEAEAEYRRAMALAPEHPWPWLGLGNLLAKHLGRPDEAEQAYREAIARDPAAAAPWNNLGILLADHLGRPEEAEHAYREAIAGDPAFAPLWNGFGNLLATHLGRPEEAERAYREAIARNPGYAAPWNGLGNVMADHLGRPKEAERAYREAIACDPASVAPHANLAWLHLDAGDATKAGAARDAIADRCPAVGLHLLDAGIAAARDNPGDALRHLALALGQPMVTPDGTSFHDDLLRLLRLLHRRGHGERLLAWFEETGEAERQAPLHAAFRALVRGDATLRDVNPETRIAAGRLYADLRGPVPPPPAPPAPRKRRR